MHRTSVSELRKRTAAAHGRYQPLVVVLVAMGLGIIGDRYMPLPAGAWWLAALVAWISWLVAWRRRCDRLAQVALLVSLAAGGAAWHHTRWNLFAEDDLGRFARDVEQPACVEVVALDEPRRAPALPYDPMRGFPMGERDRVEVAVRAIRDGASWRPASGRTTLLVNGHLLGVHAGDRLRVFASLARPGPAQNPGQFDFARHARADRRLAVLRSDFPDAVAKQQTASRWSLRRAVGFVRAAGDRVLWRRLDPERAGLAAAILLGQRSEIGAEVREPFFTTGTVHLLVVSGMHVGILAGFLLVAFRLALLPHRLSLWLLIAAVILYALVTGGRPPVVRAAVIVSIGCLASLMGRRALRFNTLAAAALLVLVLNPADLFRLGPQLSFLAVAVLMVMAGRWAGRHEDVDPLARLIAETRPWPMRLAAAAGGWYWRATLASVAVWLVVAPLIMYRFHLFSPAAVILAPLLWLPLAAALVAGFVLLVCGWIAPPIAIVCAWLSDASLTLLQGAVEGASRVPGSYFWVPGPAGWWLAGFYGGLALWVAFPRMRPPVRWSVALLAAWTAVGLGASLLGGKREELRCEFVAVGHGCSVIVELPGGQTLLYDAGRLGSPAIATRAISACLWSRGLRHLDAVVISHADADHYNALPDLLERFSVGVVYVSPVMFEGRSEALQYLRRAIEASGTPIREVHGGDRLRTRPDVLIDVRHPPPVGVLGSDNANSIVLAIEYAGRRIFLPGDLESPGLEDVLAEAPLDCDVLLAPHHGSRRSDPPGFAAWAQPEWLVISGAGKDDLRAVRETYTRAGAQVLNTGKVGAVQATIAPGRFDVTTWRAPDANGL